MATPVPASAHGACDPIPPWRRWGAGTLIAVSLLCNVTVLFVPFMSLRIGLGSDPYALLGSVRMLWDNGLWALALLVVAFSVVFPFAKLGVLAAVVRRGATGPRLGRLLAWVGVLGKWSMLDVFLVCLILSLTARQVFVGTTPMIGIPLFTAAIACSLLAGELLHREEPGDRRAAAPGRWSSAAMHLATGICLGVGVGLPVLRIDDALLVDREYSVAGMIWAMIAGGQALPGVALGLFLVVAPACAWLLGWAAWARACAGRPLGWVEPALLRLRRWSMLDVFLLALAVFLVEGRAIMDTAVQWGALGLACSLLLRLAIGRAFERLLAPR